jgi:hypothetical protein
MEVQTPDKEKQMQPTQEQDFTPDEVVLAVSLELSKGSWNLALHDGRRDKPTIHTVSGEQAGDRLVQLVGWANASPAQHISQKSR